MVERLLRNPHPPDDFGHRRTGFCLLQREGNLLICVPRFLHFQLLARRLQQGRKTLAQNGLKTYGSPRRQAVCV